MMRRVTPIAFRAASRFGAARCASAQPAILNRDMGQCQWYIHYSREAGADMGAIKSALGSLRKDCAAANVNLVLGFGPGFANEMGIDTPSDLQAYPGFAYPDGSNEAKATQEELLVWVNHNDKGAAWKVQYDVRQALGGHMKVARETPTFIYGDSLDMTGFQDGTGNPTPASQDKPVAIIPDGQPGEGGSHIIAQACLRPRPPPARPPAA